MGSVVGRLRRYNAFKAVRMTDLYAAGGKCQLESARSAYDLAHVVIVVDDLDRAVSDYRALGFTVTSPQEVEGSSVKRSYIFFAKPNRTHLELISSRLGLATKALHGLSRFGFAHRQRGALARRALARATRWRGDAATDDASPTRTDVSDGIWFRRRHQLIEDASLLAVGTAQPQQRAAHNPKGELTQHANGVTSIATVTVAVKSLEQKVASYSAHLGLQPYHWLEAPLISVRTASFSLGQTTFKLAQPTSDGAVNAYLKAHGEGPCALTFRAASPTRRLDDAHTYGIRLELIGNEARATPEYAPNHI